MLRRISKLELPSTLFGRNDLGLEADCDESEKVLEEEEEDEEDGEIERDRQRVNERVRDAIEDRMRIIEQETLGGEGRIEVESRDITDHYLSGTNEMVHYQARILYHLNTVSSYSHTSFPFFLFFILLLLSLQKLYYHHFISVFVISTNCHVEYSELNDALAPIQR